MKFKYAPGDVVILVPKDPELRHLPGKTFTIRKQTTFFGPCYMIEGFPGRIFAESAIAGLATREEKVVITTDGYHTTAKLYSGKNLLRSAKALRNPDDPFDFKIGARLAFARLMPDHEATEPSKPAPKYRPMQQLRIRAGTRIGHLIRPGSVVTVLEVLANGVYRVTGPKAVGLGHELQSVHEDDLSPL